MAIAFNLPRFLNFLDLLIISLFSWKLAKNECNQWVLSEYAAAEDVISFSSFEFEIILEELYQDVDFAIK